MQVEDGGSSAMDDHVSSIDPIRSHQILLDFCDWRGKPGKLVNIPEAQVKGLCSAARIVFLEQSATQLI